MEDFVIWWCWLLGVTDPFTAKVATALVVATPVVFVIAFALRLLVGLAGVVLAHVWEIRQ
jgi:hypothetical protein